MKEYPCIESTLDIEFHKIKVRLWIDRNTVEESYEDTEDIINTVHRILSKTEVRSEFIAQLKAAYTHINAVQIIDRTIEGDHAEGVVAYLVDFAEDVHG